MKRWGELDDPRRRVLIQALAAGLFSSAGGAAAQSIFGTAPNLRIVSDNPTLENSGQDVKYETDFRSIYAKTIDSWLGGNSVQVLGGDFRAGAPQIL